MDSYYMSIVFELISKNSDLGIAIVDKDGVIIHYNEKMGEIEGLEPKDVIGRTLLSIYPYLDKDTSSIYRCLNTGKQINKEYQTYLNEKGHKIFNIVTNIPIIINDDIIGVIEIAENINKLSELYNTVNNWLSGTQNFKHTFNKINYYTFEDFITSNQDMIKLLDRIKKMTIYDSNVLIYGETGTGKEILAQSIHNTSVRKEKPFIAQNCAAIPENLIESILFGTEKGSFTGALNKEGLFEQADGGTILLDELNSLPIYLQAKLLRVLQDGYVRRVGGSVEKRVNVRVIATINEEPNKLIREGKLREDLFYRLSSFYISIPPLRERRDDLLVLTNHFINYYSKLFNKDKPILSIEVESLFRDYEWRGNVRELINVIEYIMITIEGKLDEVVEKNNLPPYLVEKFKSSHIAEKKDVINYYEKLSDYKRDIIVKSLINNKWNVSNTAIELGIKRQTLHNKINRLNIDKDAHNFDTMP